MAAQLSLLNKIKALVSKTSKNILWRSKPKDNEISEKIAQKIQKSSYDLSLRQLKDVFTAPYLKLAEQLQVNEEQIFRAAAYNMANIAMVRKKYREDILKIFNQYADDTTKSPEQRDYLRKKIAEIKASSKEK